MCKHRYVGFCLTSLMERRSDGGEIILARGGPSCGRAAFGHHGDLGAEVDAIASH